MSVDKKVELRQQYLRKSYETVLTHEEKQQFWHAVQESLPDISGWVGAYQPIKGEIELSPALESYSVCYPKIEGENLQFYSSNEFQPGPLGVQEPVEGKKMAKESLQALLIPGLSFDRLGTRLGRGKGYYDRYLSDYKGLKLGVAKSVQFSEEPLPCDDWDVAMDFIITEKYIYKPIRRKDQLK